MSATPERVWVSPLGVFPVEMGGSVPYVPESALRAAEQERVAAREAIASEWRQEQRDRLARIHRCDSCLGVVPNEWRSEFQADLCNSCYAAAMAESWEPGAVEDVSALRAAEAERDAAVEMHDLCREDYHKKVRKILDLRHDLAALREQVRVLTPLAQSKLADIDGYIALMMDDEDASMPLAGQVQMVFALTTEQIAAARRIVEGT